MKKINITRIKSNGCLPLQKIGYFLISCLVLFTIGSCGKDKDNTLALEDGVSTIVSDLPGDTDVSVGSDGPGKEKRDFHTFLFRLSDQKQTWLKNAADSSKYMKGVDWDIAFSGFYNSILFVNNGEMNGNPAFGNSSRHKIILLRQNYDQVMTAPADIDFDKSQINDFGLNVTADGNGWYNYNITTHLVTILPNRTYVIRLSNGKYAKLSIVNVYKGNPPAVTELNWPAPYYTFKYFVQNDGSKNLKTK